MRIPSLLLLLFICIGSLSAQWGQKKIRGNGNVITEQRSASGDFTEIDASTGLRVELTPSSTVSIKVKGDENILPYVVTEISGNELSVHYKKGININTRTTTVVYVSLPKITEIDAGSAAIVKTTGAFSGDRIDIDCGSAGQAIIEFNGTTAKVEVGSAGRIELSGTLEDVALEASSAGVIDAGDCTAKIGRARANSAGSIRINVTEKLDAEASSAGSIRYTGNPDKVFTDANSGGSINRSRG